MKKYTALLILLFAAGITVILLVFAGGNGEKPDAAALNDIVMSVYGSDDKAEAVNQAEVKIGELFSDMDMQRNNRDIMLRNILLVIVILTSAGFYLLLVNINRGILAPFEKMKDFAGKVASGDLEVPLSMGKNRYFGAFTESFDIMREELHRARENEREANRSKKELVASLSHDIKTPVATIKAVTEVMAAKTKDDNEKERLKIIEAKTEQINSLITNMFHAALEELQELTVEPVETHSTVVPELIRGADYEKRIRDFLIPECIVLADILRFCQVIDNIIGNSYKYAGTPIEIESIIEEKHLIIDIKDFGSGVPEEELSLITGKFYRADNSEGKSGYGLGLYISKYLMNRMGGDLVCENLTGGFLVKIILRLA